MNPTRHSASSVVLLFAVCAGINACAANADFIALREDVTALRKDQHQLQSQVKQLTQQNAQLIARLKQEHPVDLGFHVQELQAKSQDMERDHAELESNISELLQYKNDEMRSTTTLSKRIDAVEAAFKASKENVEGAASSTTQAGDGSVCDLPNVPQPEPKFLLSTDKTSPMEDVSDILPTEAWSTAYLDYQKGDYDLAIHRAQIIIAQFPDTALAPDAHYLIGASYLRKRDCARAIAAFERMVELYPRSKKISAALWKLAIAYEAQRNPAKARTFLLQIIDHHSNTTEARLARQRLPELSR